MAKIMVVAGGTWQCPIIRLAKSMGHKVLCTNLYKDSPAFIYADESRVANVLDKERNLQIAREFTPDAVLTEQTDIAVPTVAYLAEQLGLKGISVKIASRFTNKYVMRQFVERAGFATPSYRLCYSAEDIKVFWKENGKSIIKPLDSQSSRGIHIINDYENADRYFEDCIQYSNCEKAVLIEQYIEGVEFTVDGLKTEKEYIVTAISEKEHYSYNVNIARKLLFSQYNENYDYDRLREINEDIVRTMELPFGITHAEYKYSNGKFYLLEIAARGGGTKISSDIVPMVSGINSNEIYLHMLLNQPYQIKMGRKQNCVLLGFFDFETGKVMEISGLEKAKKLEGIYEIGLEIKTGDSISQALDDRSRCGYYIIYADSKEQLFEREAAMKHMIKVVVEK